MTEYTELVVVEKDDVAHARQEAADHDVRLEDVPDEGSEPVTLALFGAAAAVGTVVHLIERRKGGQVIDLRPGAHEAVQRTPDVQFGVVVIHHVDGTITVAAKEPRSVFGQVLDALRDVLGAIATEDLEAAQETVEDAVGEAAEVTVAAPPD